MKNKTVVLGRGFLGKEFERHGFEVWDRSKFNYPQTNSEELDEYDTIINCIGCADTRYCEKQENWKHVWTVNASLVGYLSGYCKSKGKKFVHISTGCVYDKNSAPQLETDLLASHCRYVVSKLSAEFSCHPHDLIVRPRLYFSDIPDKNNLLSKLPNFSRHLNEINSFTSTRTIVEAVNALLEAEQSGVYNVSQEGYATIQEICREIGLPDKPVISGTELQTSQGLALVNNTMNIEKLKNFYHPRPLMKEIKNCWQAMA